MPTTKARKPRKQPPPVDGQWVRATIPQSEAISSRWRSGTAMSELVARCVQWVDIAGSLRARSCAHVRIRLYEPKATSRSKRIADKARGKFLRNPANGKIAEYADDAQDLAEVIDHPVLDLLRRPNAFSLGFDHAFMRHFDRLITGNAFEHCTPADAPAGLYRLAPHKTRVITSPTEFIAGYRYGEREHVETPFEVEEVNHYRFRPSPFSPVLGIGPLQAILADVDRHSASTLHDLHTWRNSGRPEGMLKLPDNATQPQIDQIRAEWRKRYQGPKNAHETFIASGIEYTPFSWAPKDLEGVASRADARLLILAAFGVPESMAELNDANLASSWTGNIQFRRETIWPDLVQDALALNEFLLPRFGIAPGEMWLAYDNPVPDDDKALLERNRTYVSAGVVTINEVRAEEGYDPSKDPLADQLLYQGVPLGALSTMGLGSIGPDGRTMEPRLAGEAGAQDVTVPQGGATPPPAPGGAVVQDTALNGAQMAEVRETVAAAARGEIPHEAALLSLQIALPTVNPDLLQQLIQTLDGFTPAQPEAEPAPPVAPGDEEDEPEAPPPKGEKSAAVAVIKTDTDLILARDAHACCTHGDKEMADYAPKGDESAFERALRGFMADAEAAFMAQADPITGGVPADKWAIIFAEAVEEPVLRLFSAGFRKGPVLVNAVRPGAAEEIDFSQAGELAQQALSSYTIRLRESVIRTMTTRLVAAAVSPIDDPAFVAPAQLNQALAAAIQHGDSLAGTIARVRDEFENLGGYPAERIARTETQRAYGAGKIASWKQVPGLTHKRWLLSGAPCPMCMDLAARRSLVRIDEPFARIGETFGGVQITYADVHENTLHPNDSCAVTFAFEDEVQGGQEPSP